LATGYCAKFVHIDTFVDAVKTDYKNGFVIRPHANTIRLILGPYALMVNIQTKHYRTLPTNKKLETSAKQAVEKGADAIVVTGLLTGKKPSKSKIGRARRVVGEFPIYQGSGADEFNVAETYPLVDGIIVGTGLKVDSITENPVDPERVQRFMDAVYKLR
jgi:predicted TIM-barrel enzyme